MQSGIAAAKQELCGDVTTELQQEQIQQLNDAHPHPECKLPSIDSFLLRQSTLPTLPTWHVPEPPVLSNPSVIIKFFYP